MVCRHFTDSVVAGQRTLSSQAVTAEFAATVQKLQELHETQARQAVAPKKKVQIWAVTIPGSPARL